MYVSTKAIVLSRIKYSDNTFIFKAFTEIDGIQSFFLRIPKKSRTLLNTYLPLTILNLTYKKKANTSVYNIKESKPLSVFNGYTNDIRLISVKSVITELIIKCLSEQQQDLNLFVFLYSTSERLSISGGIAKNELVYFCARFFNLLGFSFDEYTYMFANSLTDVEARFLDIVSATENISNVNFQLLKDSNQLVEKIILCYKSAILDQKTINSIDIYKEVFYK